MYEYLSYDIELRKLLIHIGITPNYRGYNYIVFAIQMVFKDPRCLQYVTKELYPGIAEEYDTDWRAVEHGIRIAILRSWKKDSARFENTFGIWGKEIPSVGKFLAVVYEYLRMKDAEKVV